MFLDNVLFSRIKMSENNPWQVDNLQAFAFLNCPECTFKSKHEDFFRGTVPCKKTRDFAHFPYKLANF